MNLSSTKEKEASPQYLANGDLVYAAEQRRNGWQVVRVPAGDTARVVLASDPTPITSLALSPDGERVAVVAGRITDRGRGRAEFVFSLRDLAGGVPLVVPILGNEQIVF